MDGVLVDSEPLHHCAANAVLAEDGHPPLSVAEYRRYLGVTDDDMWRDLRTMRGLGRPHEHYLRRFDRLVLAEYRLHAVAAPGAVDLLDWLTACGLPLAVASSSRSAWVKTCLARDRPAGATSIASSRATWWPGPSRIPRSTCWPRAS